MFPRVPRLAMPPISSIRCGYAPIEEPLMTMPLALPAEWRHWLTVGITRGSDPCELAGTLVIYGFSPAVVVTPGVVNAASW